MSKFKQAMSNKNINRKKLVLALFATLLLVAAVVSVVAGVSSHHSSSYSTPSHAVIKSACSSTLYPDLCFSSMATSEPALTNKVSSHAEVILLALNITTGFVQRSYFTIEKLLSSRRGLSLSKRVKTALHDCLETVDLTLGDLEKARDDLIEEYRMNGGKSKKSVYEYAEDLKTVISSAITNQVTCLDGFSHSTKEKLFRKYLQAGQLHVQRLCSNALAMAKNLTDTHIAEYENNMKKMGRKTIEVEVEAEVGDGDGGIGWPEWMSAADRRLLQSSTVKADVVVAADGSGNYRKVSDAVAAAPDRSSRRYVIRIKAGVYRENVQVSSKKTNIMFMGDGSSKTIITASRSVAGGSTTFNSATVAVVGDGFLARGISFQNTAGPSGMQAVALRVGSDRSAFYLCGFAAYQDTLYVHTNRQFFVNCFIAGTVDFIFGNSAVVLQDCDIKARRPNPKQKNMVTAQGRVDPNQNTGIVIQKCRIGATRDLQAEISSFPTYLGRPWKEYSRTVVMQSTISNAIHPAGWFEWDGNFALNTLYYGEYKNSGPGADTSRRVRWKGFRVITSASEAQGFTPGNFIAGSGWLGSTGFPYSLGL